MIGLRKSASQQVTYLLETQHKALLGGDLDRLGRMAPELERGFERLRRDGATHEDLSRIKDAAARNARLLTAAQAGVAQARSHLQSSRSPELTTYDAQGRSHAGIPATSHTLARR
ncbi:MAG: recombinase family protein [Roseicyclus sp.]|nr:recombinase family protein [Roseicyclus sp.]